MTTVAVRLPDDLVAAVDALVASGRFSTRTDAVKAGLQSLVRAAERERIDRQIAHAYRQLPETEEEIASAQASARALIDEEPW